MLSLYCCYNATTTITAAATIAAATAYDITDLEFLREEEGDDGGKAREQRGQEHTDIAHINGDVEEIEEMVDGCRCHHQTFHHKVRAISLIQCANAYYTTSISLELVCLSTLYKKIYLNKVM